MESGGIAIGIAAIVGVTGNGSGCRGPGSFTWEVAPDRRTFTLRFPGMSTQHDPGGPTLQRLNCAVGITLHIPQGWTLAVGASKTSGRATLTSGAAGPA